MTLPPYAPRVGEPVDQANHFARIGHVPTRRGARARRRPDMNGDPAEPLDGGEAFLVALARADVHRQRGAEAREQSERRAAEARAMRARLERLGPAP